MIAEDILVKAENVSKKFCRDLKRSLWYGVKDLSSELLGRSRQHQLRKKEFWALRDLAFEVKRGQCLGIVGPNGAGKTTLLKLLSGLIKPDTGSIAMRGRVQSLIQLGAGFNPILTGRENVYVNSSVMGVPRRELDRAVDEIIDFSEIGDFIDAPVQSYSAGMKVRLGFSVSILLNPDIMLVDEVLAVGDLAFQSKCTEAIQRIKTSGTAFIFVSHNLGLIHNLSDQVAYLTGGKIQYLGEPADAILRYVSDSPDHTSNFVYQKGTEQYIRLQEALFLDPSGNPVETVVSGGPLRIRLVFDAIQRLQEPWFYLLFGVVGQQVMAACINQSKTVSRPSFPTGRHVFDIAIESFPLLAGKYVLNMTLSGADRVQKFGRITNMGSILVTPSPNQVAWHNRGGYVEIGSAWETVHLPDSPGTAVGE